MPNGTAGGRDELSRTLRELRKTGGLSTREAGQRVGWSQAKISRLETGRNLPRPQDVAALADVYQATPAVRKRLDQLAQDVQAWSRRVVLNRGGGEFQRQFDRIEQASAWVRTYSPAVIPGLLQTRDYARSIFTAYAATPRTPAQLEASLDTRMARQRRLGEPGRRFTLIVTEGALGWRADSTTVMVEQLEQIAALNKPGVEVGIIPWGARATVFPLHTWDMYDERAVSFGTVASTALLTNPQDVAIYDDIFGQLVQMAAFGDEARAILIQVADRYRGLR